MSVTHQLTLSTPGGGGGEGPKDPHFFRRVIAQFFKKKGTSKHSPGQIGLTVVLFLPRKICLLLNKHFETAKIFPPISLHNFFSQPWPDFLT